jgi:hypothetical protein
MFRVLMMQRYNMFLNKTTYVHIYFFTYVLNRIGSLHR